MTGPSRTDWGETIVLVVFLLCITALGLQLPVVLDYLLK